MAHVDHGGEVHAVTTELDRDHLAAIVATRPVDRIPATLHVHDGDPASSLVEAADRIGATLIVLGAHAGDPLRLRAVGSTAAKVLARARRPVVVVHAGSTAPSRNAPVVVGIGDGEDTRVALAWAVEESGARPLRLVQAVDPYPVFRIDGAVDVMASYLDPERLLHWAEEELRSIATASIPTGSSVQVSVHFGRVGETLVSQSNDAALLVVGKHFDGPLTGYLMGRSLHHALIHSTCPVIVVPPHATVIRRRSSHPR